MGRKRGPQIPVVASGGTGDDQVCRDVLASSGAVDKSVIREGECVGGAPRLTGVPALAVSGPPFTGETQMSVRGRVTV